MGTTEIDSRGSRGAVGGAFTSLIFEQQRRHAAATLTEIEANRGRARAELKARLLYITQRPPALVRIKPRSGEVRGPEGWRRDVGQACTDLRLTTLPSRPRIQYDQVLFRATVAELTKRRLLRRILPIDDIADRITWQIGRLAHMLREPWAPSWHDVNR